MNQTQNKPPSDGSAIFLLIFGGGWAIFALIFVMIGFLIVRGETYFYNRLLEEGQVARAIITDLSIDKSTESTGYYVAYKFDAPVNGDPTSFSSTSGVSAEFYNSLSIDQRIEVIYVASDPTIVRIKSQLMQPNTTVGWVFGGLGILFLVVGLVVGFLAVRSRRKSV